MRYEDKFEFVTKKDHFSLFSYPPDGKLLKACFKCMHTIYIHIPYLDELGEKKRKHLLMDEGNFVKEITKIRIWYRRHISGTKNSSLLNVFWGKDIIYDDI